MISIKSSAQILKMIEQARLQKNRYLLIDKDLSYYQLKRYKNFPIFNKNTFKGGLIVEQEIKRENPLGKIAERTIGYEKKDKDGTYFRVGLEGAFSQYLRCLLYTSPSPRDVEESRMPSSA